MCVCVCVCVCLCVGGLREQLTQEPPSGAKPPLPPATKRQKWVFHPLQSAEGEQRLMEVEKQMGFYGLSRLAERRARPSSTSRAQAPPSSLSKGPNPSWPHHTIQVYTTISQ